MRTSWRPWNGFWTSIAGLEWHQENPNQLWYAPFGEAKRLITRNGAGTSEASRSVSRLPGDHPEGYLEAFATLYAEFSDRIRGRQPESQPDPIPSVYDGLEGMRVIDAAVRSKGSWLRL